MKNLKFSKRINNIPVSIFSKISKLAVEQNAINLGQGFPDFDGPDWIMNEAYSAMQTGKNQYAPSNGILSLRRAIAEVDKKQYGIEYNPDTEITITAGATEALFSTINALVEKNDEVIIFEPFYDSYQADVILAGGTPVYVTLHKPDFSFDFEELENAVSPKTKLLILNTPHNPTGKVFDIEELEFIARLAQKHDFFVLSDEVYEFLTYDNVKHIPIASLEGMRDRTITISSTGKTFGMTGWKVGYACASAEITVAIQKVHQWVTFAVNTPAQHAMAYAFGRLDEYLPDFRTMYQEKRDFAFNALLKTELKPHKPKGSYFIMADIPPNKYKDDMEAAVCLIRDYKVAVIPPSVFYENSKEGRGMLRICFAKKQETLENGLKILTELGQCSL
jgi:aspartate/methionine/tyrosine aminotransferase